MKRIDLLEEYLLRVFASSRLYAEGHLTVDVIINPYAGSLSTDARCEKTVEQLELVTRGLKGPLRQPRSLTVRFHQTHYVGHARELAADVLSRGARDQHLILSAGGDGTHGEVLTTYLTDPRPRVRYFRLPLGTGNDGADAATLPEAVNTLLGNAREHIDGHLEVQCTGMPRLYGLNIASVGLDAYVGYLTNRLKGKFGGDLYKVIADVMTLLYEHVVGVKDMTVEVDSGDGKTTERTGRYFLCAVGVSGGREYGGGKKVLPGCENICIIDRIGLVGKIRLKALFYRGAHVHESNVVMATGGRVVISYDHRVPLQVDGETVWLRPENFPVEMSVHPPGIPVLRPTWPVREEQVDVK